MADTGNQRMQCHLTTDLSVEEKKRFTEIAQENDLPYCRILRQLIRYALRENIDWVGLFKKTNEFVMKEPLKNERRASIRTRLTIEMWTAFNQLAEERGTTVNIVLRRLIVLLNQQIVDLKTVFFNE